MYYRLFWLVGLLLLPAILFSQIDISLQEKKQYVIFEVTSPFPISLLETEKISGGEAITISGENIQLPEKFSQLTLNHSFIKYIIQNQTVNNHAQFILKEGRAGFSYYINTVLDSLYRFQIHIFPASRNGKDPIALYLKGVDYHRNNQLNTAIQYYRKSIRIKAQNGNAYYKAGQIRLIKKEYNNALINFNKAIRFKTDSLKAYQYLSQLYERQKNRAKAEQFSARYQNHQTQILTARKKLINKANEPSSPPQDEKEQQAATVNTFPKIVIIFFTVGIIILVGIIIIRKNRKVEYEPEPETERAETNFEEELQEAPEVDSVDDSTEDFSGREPLQYSEEAETAEEEPPAVDREQEISGEEIKKAEETDLGDGELDLTLDIKSKLKSKRKLAGKEEFIIEMYNRGMKIEEIARELNLNFGEVDLVIGLNKHRLLKYRP